MIIDFFRSFSILFFVQLVLMVLSDRVIKNGQMVIVKDYQPQSTKTPICETLCFVDERRDILFLKRAFAY
jgi:hypothetical protein